MTTPPLPLPLALLFSATFRKKVERLCRDTLIDPLRVVVGELGEANTDVTQTVFVFPETEDKWGWLAARLVQFTSSEAVCVRARVCVYMHACMHVQLSLHVCVLSSLVVSWKCSDFCDTEVGLRSDRGETKGKRHTRYYPAQSVHAGREEGRGGREVRGEGEERGEKREERRGGEERRRERMGEERGKGVRGERRGRGRERRESNFPIPFPHLSWPVAW